MPDHIKQQKVFWQSRLICSSLQQENVYRKHLRELVQILFKTESSRNIIKIEKVTIMPPKLKQYNYKICI